jgi:hypothetical protein
MDPNNLKDPWIELVRDGVFPEATANWLDVKMWEKDVAEGVDRNAADYEPVDKVFYRSGSGIDLQAISYVGEEDKFKDANGARLSDHYAWKVEFQYVITNSLSNVVSLGELPVDGHNGYGPVEVNTSNGEEDAFDGNTMRLNDVQYSTGLGVHANSELTYDLNGNYSIFKAYVGIDDESNGGSMSFQIWGDNTLMYDSGFMDKYSDTQYVYLNVKDVSALTLKAVDGGNGIKCDHGNWAKAELIRLGYAGETAPLMVNDTDSGIIYQNVDYYNNRTFGDYRGDVHQVSENGGSVEYTFYGTGIEYIGVKNGDVGEQKVTLDGESVIVPGYASFYSPQSVLFSRKGLALGYHTIRIEKLNGNWMVIDGFKVYNPSLTGPLYLSELAWDSASNGYGPVEIDQAVGGQGGSDGGTIR